MTLDRRAFGTRALAPELPRDCDLQNSRLAEFLAWSGLLCWWSDSENTLQRRRMNAVVGSRGWTPSIGELSSDAAAAWVTSEWPCEMVLRSFEKSTFRLVCVCKNEFMRLLWLMTLPLRRMMCCWLERVSSGRCGEIWLGNLESRQDSATFFRARSQSVVGKRKMPASSRGAFPLSDGRSKHV